MTNLTSLPSSSASATSSGVMDLTNRFALDVQGFDALRVQANANPEQGLKAAAKQFDAVFTEMMLKSMRDATPQDSPLDSQDTAQFTSMLDQQLSQHMSAKGIGIADMLVKQLMRTGGGEGHEGNMAALNALTKAMSSASPNGSNGSNESLSAGKGYTAASALTPAIRGYGAQGASQGSAASDATDESDTSSKVDAFVDKLAAPAQAASAATGIPARFIVGQAALESNWGKSEIKKADGSTSHNVFGIKATKDWSGKTASTTTTEYVNGQPQKVTQTFRAYDSYEEAMTDYAKMLKNNPRYASVVGSRDVNSFAHGMQRAGYATDPNYARKLISVMQQVQVG